MCLCLCVWESMFMHVYVCVHAHVLASVSGYLRRSKDSIWCPRARIRRGSELSGMGAGNLNHVQEWQALLTAETHS